MKLETFPHAASAVIDPRLPDLRRLTAHTKLAYIFTPASGNQDDDGCEIDLTPDSVDIIHPMVDLSCSDGRVIALVRTAPGARKSTQPQPSGQIKAPDGTLDIYMLAEPIKLPVGWLDAILIAPVIWAAAERKFELFEGEPKLVDALSTPVAEAREGETDPVAEARQGETDPDAEARQGETDPVAEARQGETDPVGTPINDALILGTFTDEQTTWLSTASVQTMQGAMYGARHPRNTQDGAWKNKPMSLIEFTGAITAHPVAKTKFGTCIVLGSSIEGARKAKAMDSMSFLGLDIDSGAQLDDVIKIIQARNLMCFIYTTHSHGKTGLELDRDVVLRKLGTKENPSLEQVQTYLREHDKNRYEESFIQNVIITDHRKQVKEGIVIALDTPPLHKFRLLFPFLKPVKIVDLADTHQGALDFWEDSITGFAHTTLGVHFDTSCTDPSRLFFLPRHPKGAEFHSYVLAGDPLDFNNVPQVKKSTYTKHRELNAFILADDSDEGSAPPTIFLPSGATVNAWHSKMGKDRFMVADCIEHFCPDKVRRAGNEASGSIHIECPFEHEHSSVGGTGTMATNCIDSTSDYWTIHCKHDACQGRHKTAFLGEMIERGWFEESVLFDKDWMLPADDDDEDAVIESGAAGANAAEGPPSIEVLVAELPDPCPDERLVKLFVRMHRRGIGEADKVQLFDLACAKTGIGKRPLNKLWKNSATVYAEQLRRDSDELPIQNRTDTDNFRDLVEYGRHQIAAVNKDEPQLFHYLQKMVVIRDDANAQAKIKFLDRDGFANFLNSVAEYRRAVSDEATRGVSAPLDVINHIFSADYGVYPGLRGLVTSPTFSKSGRLILTEGYHPEGKLFYAPKKALVVPPINPVPTADEVREAVRLLVTSFADFPLGAMKRAEIVEKTMAGEDVPAVANLLALTLLPFIREMIKGPTPGHLLTKPAPGTGASLLTDALSIICTGETTPAMAMPGNKDEMGKTLTSVLANGQNIVFFDNINHSVDSGELASAMTANVYQARILGKSETVDCEVRCVWIFTGNNAKLSSELARRLVFIDLDARSSSPEKRTGFAEKDLLEWVRKNRGRLVGACLTLIQNWIAKGSEGEDSAVMASFESYSRVMGGILRDAKVAGFIANRDIMRDRSKDDSDDPFAELVAALAVKFKHGQVFRKNGYAAFKDQRCESMVEFLNGYHEDRSNDVILIPHSGYVEMKSGDEVNYTYNGSKKLSSALAKASGRRFGIEVFGQMQDVGLDTEHDTKGGTPVYILYIGPWTGADAAVVMAEQDGAAAAK